MAHQPNCISQKRNIIWIRYDPMSYSFFFSVNNSNNHKYLKYCFCNIFFAKSILNISVEILFFKQCLQLIYYWEFNKATSFLHSFEERSFTFDMQLLQ